MSHISAPLDESLVQNILAMQANALNQGQDSTAWLIAQYAAPTSPAAAELVSLLRLAQQVQRVLVPVPAPARLRQQTYAPPVPRPTAARRWPWWVGAAVGSAAGVCGFWWWWRGRATQAQPA